MTAVLEDETLAGVDEKTRQALEVAADNYENAPARLKAAILAAARKGEKPGRIARTIRYAYSYDYVARIVREDRDANPGAYRRDASAS